jgi:hypothetical protein
LQNRISSPPRADRCEELASAQKNSGKLTDLNDNGAFRTTLGVDYEKLGLEMGRVDISTEDTAYLLEWAERCPLFVNGLQAIGGKNATLFFLSEDMEMFRMIVDEHVRKLRGVREATFNPVLSWVRDFPTQVDLTVKKQRNPPCKTAPYCVRCPANPDYNGRVWNYSEHKSPQHGKGRPRPHA